MARPRFPRARFRRAGPLGLGQRWTVTRKREVALRLLRGEPVELLSRQFGRGDFLGSAVALRRRGRERCLAQGTQGRSGEGGTGHRHEADRGVDHAKVELLEAKSETNPALWGAEVAAMSAATSPGTGLANGLQRVCAAWGFARSSFYAMKSRQQAKPAERPSAKAGDRSPHLGPRLCWWPSRPTWKIPLGGRGTPQGLGSASGLSWHPCFPQAGAPGDAREQPMFSPHRCRRRGGNPHVGEIISGHAPNLMWGTDGVRVFTVDDGWGWVTAIEHWHAECVGWHVCKRGDRFAALQPISMGLARLYASTSAGAARRAGQLADGYGSGVLVGPRHHPGQVNHVGDPASDAPFVVASDQRRRRPGSSN